MKELLPTGEVGTTVVFTICSPAHSSYPEKASVDESFIDLSIPVRDALLERYPYLAIPPQNAENGLDSALPPPPHVSFSGLGNLVPIDSSLLGKDTKETTDAVEEAERNLPTTWHDVGLKIAAELMAHVRKEIHEQLGYLTSAVSLSSQFYAFNSEPAPGNRAKQVLGKARGFISQIQYPKYTSKCRDTRIFAAHAIPEGAAIL